MIFQTFHSFFYINIDKYANEIIVKLSNGITGVLTMCIDDTLGLKEVFLWVFNDFWPF